MTMDSRQILKRHGRSFHFASLFLSADHRGRAADLYAFCRQVDDIADEATDKNKAWDELETIKTNLSKGTNGESRAAYDLVATVQSDLRTVDLQTQDDLIQYAYGVAGTVGLLMCDVLGVHDARAKSYAIDLGIGMQLTNIARDVQADALIGRRYLPMSWTKNLSIGGLARPGPKEQSQIAQGIKQLLTLADQYYDSAMNGLGYLPVRARFAIFVAARVYAEIGYKIRRNAYCVWEGRTIVSTARKLAVTLRAIVDFLTTPRLHRRGVSHDETLHRALASCAPYVTPGNAGP